MDNPFAEIVLSGQLLLAIPVALLAGLVSFASPCVLPLVPGYLGYVGGISEAGRAAGSASGGDEKAARRAGRRRMLLGIALFILGFSLIFLAYSAVGSPGLFYGGDYKQLVVQTIIALAAVTFTGIMTVIIAFIVKPLGWRVAKEDEHTGIDETQHAETAYELV